MAYIGNNSVQSIIKKCNSMIELCEDSVFMDLKMLASTLKKDCEELSTIFDSNPDSAELVIKKRKVNNLAIRVEFLLSVRLKEFEDIRDARREAEDVYYKCKDLLYRSNAEQLGPFKYNELVLDTRRALQYYTESLDICFYKSNEDAAFVNRVSDMEGLV